MRILVVDDELDTAQTIAFLLADSGHEVRYAISGAAALAIAKSEKPEVVVLDLGLPDIDGLDLARLLKHDGAASPSARIIAITGRTKHAESLALEAGCERFLRKPVHPRELEAIISGSKDRELG
jgi:two-component system, OmpR family, alkaline phosphatase synthesis response regulator PhoP